MDLANPSPRAAPANRAAAPTAALSAAGAMPWHATPVADVLRTIDVAPARGLSEPEAARRLAAQGPNALATAETRPVWRILAGQFADVMVAVLAGAAVLAWMLDDRADAGTILAILGLNALLGAVQEYRAERALSALRRLAEPKARVLRDGTVRMMEVESVVAGDIVRLDAGDLVPADLRLISVNDLHIDESTLTGESERVAKDTGAVAADTALGDRRGMAYRGTTVVSGRGMGVVVASGVRTELGRITVLLSSTSATPSPLQRHLAWFTRRLALAVLAISAVLFLSGVLRGEPAGMMLLTALSLAVAAIPEALPAVVTVALALGARRAAARRALIRRLPAVETLGSVTYICTDKTGTLTENRMRVSALRTADALDADPPPPSVPAELLLALALSNDAEADATGTLRGDPTEVALCEAAAARGVRKAEAERAYPRIAELPFTSARGRMTTIHRGADAVIAYTKGAPERVIERCTGAVGKTAARPPSHEALLAASERLAASGMRVLAIAWRELPNVDPTVAPELAERDLTFLGLVGLLDPPRAHAREAVAECRRAGIAVMMVTGDHVATARAVAAQVGISTDVRARVTPEEKLAIVRDLQMRGEVVAMTGDGVNDAPALKQADIGVAMGRSGTDVAREASDMILLDDHFATIVDAVREGRRIHDNIRRFVRYALTGNSAEVWTLVLAPLVGLPVPLLPAHLLWINLVTDGLPGIALGLEPAEPDVMTRPPRPPGESVFARGLWQHAVWVGMVMGGVTLAVAAWAWSHDSAHDAWQSMTLTVLAFLQLGHLLAIRSEREALHVGFFRNRWLLAAVGMTVVLQLAVLYTPFLNRVMHTVPLSPAQLAWCAVLSLAGLLAVEAEKAAVRRGWLARAPAGG